MIAFEIYVTYTNHIPKANACFWNLSEENYKITDNLQQISASTFNII